jgi:hypothetical protein
MFPCISFRKQRLQSRLSKIINSEFIITQEIGIGRSLKPTMKKDRSKYEDPSNNNNNNNNSSHSNSNDESHSKLKLRKLYGRKQEIEEIFQHGFPNFTKASYGPMFEVNEDCRMMIIDGRSGYGKTALLNSIANKLHFMAQKHSSFNMMILPISSVIIRPDSVPFYYWKQIMLQIIYNHVFQSFFTKSSSSSTTPTPTPSSTSSSTSTSSRNQNSSNSNKNNQPYHSINSNHQSSGPHIIEESEDQLNKIHEFTDWIFQYLPRESQRTKTIFISWLSLQFNTAIKMVSQESINDGNVSGGSNGNMANASTVLELSHFHLQIILETLVQIISNLISICQNVLLIKM